MLEVHEQLERPLHEVTEDGELDENEKAIVREMCNVSQVNAWGLNKLANILQTAFPNVLSD